MGIVPSAYFLLPIYIPAMILFYWIDASAPVARRSDPLLRDTFHWRQSRTLLWTFNIVIIGSYLFTVTYLQATGKLPSTSNPPPDLIFLFALFISPVLVPMISGAALLPIWARRSRDTTLRRHLRWFGLFSLFLLVGTLASIVAYPEHHAGIGFLTYASLFVGGYFLYRSARSLAPLNRITVEEAMIQTAKGLEGRLPRPTKPGQGIHYRPEYSDEFDS